MFPPNKSVCLTTTDTSRGIGAELKTQAADYFSKYTPDNTCSSAFSLKDLKDIVADLESYNAGNPSEQITAVRFAKLIVDSSELDPSETGKTTTLAAVPAFENGKSVYDVLPSGTAGTTPANPPAMYISTRPCPKWCA